MQNASSAAAVPRVMHMIWLQGFAALPAALQPYLGANRAFASAHGWELRLWDGASIERELQADAVRPSWRAAYGALPHLHQRVDLARYVLLYLHGGLSVDADARVIRDPLDSPLVQQALRRCAPSDGATAMSYSSGSTLKAWLYTAGESFKHVNNAILLTTPRRRVWADYIDAVVANLDARAAGAARRAPLDALLGALTRGAPASRKALDIAASTGPMMHTRFWRAAAARGDAALLPSDVFEPCNLECRVTPRTAVVHEHSLTWLPEKTVRAVRAASAAVPLVVALLVALLAWSWWRQKHTTPLGPRRTGAPAAASVSRRSKHRGSVLP